MGTAEFMWLGAGVVYKRHDWTQAQRDVIEAPANAKVIVEAGPGTGKTAVACARVAHLIDSGALVGARALMISFTRAAVGEIRDRLASYCRDVDVACEVSIRTIDSLAWELREGYEDATRVSVRPASYDVALTRARRTLEAGDGLAREFVEGRYDHVLVDEAQDVMGERAELLRDLLLSLRSDCGVTVFIDRAQAIYGFTSDEEKDRDGSIGPFRELLTTTFKIDRTVRLDKIHRTRDERLLRVFDETRRAVLAEDPRGVERHETVLEAAYEGAHERLNEPDLQDLAGQDNALVLYRRRAEVLVASSWLSNQGVAHRLRMSGLPEVMPPWIACLMHDFVGLVLTETEMARRWEERHDASLFGSIEREPAWELLRRVAWHRRGVDVEGLRELIARERPPIELCLPAFGHRGPILSTIHASKGRQADRVRLMLLRPVRTKLGRASDWDEESRVAYVGATRARRTLEFGKGQHKGAKVLDSGRVFSRKGRPVGVQVQLGLAGDLDLVAALRSDGPLVMHRRLIGWGGTIELEARAEREHDWRYRLVANSAEEEVTGGWLSEAAQRDLVTAVRSLRPRAYPSNPIRHIYSVGLCTRGLTAHAAEGVPAPASQSRIVLAPMLKAFTMIYPKRGATGAKENERLR